MGAVPMELIRSLVARLRSFSRRASGRALFGEHSGLKQLALTALAVLLIGWIVGEVTAPSAAERLDESIARSHHHLAKDYTDLGKGTIEIAANLKDDASNRNLPPEIIDARTKGQQAREAAIRDAIGKVFPKEGNWGMGGPEFPLKVALPQARPVETAEVPTTAIYDFSPLPAVAPPSNPWFGPGDPNVPQHFLPGDIFGPSSPVPEPSTWALMILGFAAVALRLKASRTRRA